MAGDEARHGLVAHADVGLDIGAVEARHQDGVTGVEQKLKHEVLAGTQPIGGAELASGSARGPSPTSARTAAVENAAAAHR